MAVTRKEPNDIAELGPIGIVREAFKLYAAHFKVYVSIQMAFVLPLLIVTLIAEYFVVMRYFPLPPNNMNGSFGSSKTPRFVGAGNAFNGGLSNGTITGQVEVFLISMATSLAFQAVAALPQSTTLYTVGLHYAGKPVSFVEAVRAATPRLWMRLALTVIYLSVISFSISLVETLVSMLLQKLQSAVLLMLFVSLVVNVLSVVVGLAIGTLRIISSGVSVLEEDYGWAAMKKGLELLKGKVKVAIFFQLLWILPTSIEFGVAAAFLFQLKKDDFNVSDVALLSFTVVVLLAWMLFIWEVQSLCVGVLYVSFKAYHGESLSDSFHQKRNPVDGYESLGDEGQEPMLKGNVV